ncbi:non-ribosomal peptide synthase [Nostoc sp. CENA67]|uniref:Non-ribosomal peptide synthase n=1 Tax=Amazonocrinis nigriterrae CENA67 TaxID=2794033 RepID=A0A8J7HXC5_9NOST|nr:hypothetical protein [Amazonocrinis nigriterrae]MBH8564119.1 non-ribosomal peptide synthase [Amazonocrinis nigriterrae CENA67]
MNPSDFVINLTQQGVQLSVDNNKLNIRSPKGVITPEIQAELMTYKTEILALLRDVSRSNVDSSATDIPLAKGLNLQTIGRLIGESGDGLNQKCKQPIIDPKLMAQRLTVTFRPLPNGYNNEEILRFRTELKQQMQSYGVTIKSWEEATKEFDYQIQIPLINWKKNIKTRVVKTGIHAVIDVEIPLSLCVIGKKFIAEKFYQSYSRFILKGKKVSVSRIARLISWAEEYAAKYIEDPTNTQVIVLTDLDQEFVDSQTSYQQKIKIGLNTLVRTFSEIVIGIASDKFSILNMNLSDSVFSTNELDNFVLQSLIPKIYVPILPLPLSKFKIGNYNFIDSHYAKQLVALSNHLADTNLFPPGYKLSEVIKRQSHRDIVDIIVNGRTGVSYGFVAYVEPPHYLGEKEITEKDWESLYPIAEFSNDDVRQNSIGRRYLKTKIGGEYKFQQIPDVWVLSARSGSNKTNLSLESDILRIGLTDRLLLQLPQGIDHQLVDIKPSYDVYVMLGISLAAALYAPELIKNGAPIVHFHGYPAFEWFKPNEYCVGVDNPSVPCGTYESGVFNFLGIYQLAKQSVKDIALVSLVEPDHGTNFIAHDLEYLVERLKTGCRENQIELGGKHFMSLKAKLSDRRI